MLLTPYSTGGNSAMLLRVKISFRRMLFSIMRIMLVKESAREGSGSGMKRNGDNVVNVITCHSDNKY